MSPDDPDGGWATRPQDTRERTCECGPAGLSVLHTFRLARHPDPSTVTVTRTYEATVEWTADLSLPAWLRAVAEVAQPYEADRFGTTRSPDSPGEGPERDGGGDRTGPTGGREGPGDGRDGFGFGPDGAGADGRFRAAPADATVRPAGDHPAGLADPYHYWNTPLARLLADEEYPGGVTSLTVDLLDGPNALWCSDATAGVDADELPGDRAEYARVGLEFTARERFQRPSGSAGDDGSADDAGADPWTRAGDPAAPVTGRLAPLVEATFAFPARDHCLDRDDPLPTVEAVESRVGAVWEAFRHRAGDPYAIPESAVEAAIAAFDP